MLSTRRRLNSQRLGFLAAVALIVGGVANLSDSSEGGQDSLNTTNLSDLSEAPQPEPGILSNELPKDDSLHSNAADNQFEGSQPVAQKNLTSLTIKDDTLTPLALKATAMARDRLELQRNEEMAEAVAAAVKAAEEIAEVELAEQQEATRSAHEQNAALTLQLVKANADLAAAQVEIDELVSLGLVAESLRTAAEADVARLQAEAEAQAQAMQVAAEVERATLEAEHVGVTFEDVEFDFEVYNDNDDGTKVVDINITDAEVKQSTSASMAGSAALSADRGSLDRGSSNSSSEWRRQRRTLSMAAYAEAYETAALRDAEEFLSQGRVGAASDTLRGALKGFFVPPPLAALGDPLSTSTSKWASLAHHYHSRRHLSFGAAQNKSSFSQTTARTVMVPASLSPALPLALGTLLRQQGMHHQAQQACTTALQFAKVKSMQVTRTTDASEAAGEEGGSAGTFYASSALPPLWLTTARAHACVGSSLLAIMRNPVSSSLSASLASSLSAQLPTPATAAMAATSLRRATKLFDKALARPPVSSLVRDDVELGDTDEASGGIQPLSNLTSPACPLACLEEALDVRVDLGAALMLLQSQQRQPRSSNTDDANAESTKSAPSSSAAAASSSVVFAVRELTDLLAVNTELLAADPLDLDDLMSIDFGEEEDIQHQDENKTGSLGSRLHAHGERRRRLLARSARVGYNIGVATLVVAKQQQHQVQKSKSSENKIKEVVEGGVQGENTVFAASPIEIQGDENVSTFVNVTSNSHFGTNSSEPLHVGDSDDAKNNNSSQDGIVVEDGSYDGYLARAVAGLVEARNCLRQVVSLSYSGDSANIDNDKDGELGGGVGENSYASTTLALLAKGAVLPVSPAALSLALGAALGLQATTTAAVVEGGGDGLLSPLDEAVGFMREAVGFAEAEQLVQREKLRLLKELKLQQQGQLKPATEASGGGGGIVVSSGLPGPLVVRARLNLALLLHRRALSSSSVVVAGSSSSSPREFDADFEAAATEFEAVVAALDLVPPPATSHSAASATTSTSNTNASLKKSASEQAEALASALVGAALCRQKLGHQAGALVHLERLILNNTSSAASASSFAQGGDDGGGVHRHLVVVRDLLPSVLRRRVGFDLGVALRKAGRFREAFEVLLEASKVKVQVRHQDQSTDTQHGNGGSVDQERRGAIDEDAAAFGVVDDDVEDDEKGGGGDVEDDERWTFLEAADEESLSAAPASFLSLAWGSEEAPSPTSSSSPLSAVVTPAFMPFLLAHDSSGSGSTGSGFTSELYLQLGLAAHVLGSFSDASAFYRRALHHQPNKVAALKLLAAALEDKDGQESDAKQQQQPHAVALEGPTEGAGRRHGLLRQMVGESAVEPLKQVVASSTSASTTEAAPAASAATAATATQTATAAATAAMPPPLPPSQPVGTQNEVRAKGGEERKVAEAFSQGQSAAAGADTKNGMRDVKRGGEIESEEEDDDVDSSLEDEPPAPPLPTFQEEEGSADDSAAAVRSAGSYLKMGKAFASQGKWDQALKECKKAMKKAPSLAEPYALAAKAAEARRQFNESAHGYLDALGRNSSALHYVDNVLAIATTATDLQQIPAKAVTAATSNVDNGDDDALLQSPAEVVLRRLYVDFRRALDAEAGPATAGGGEGGSSEESGGDRLTDVRLALSSLLRAKASAFKAQSKAYAQHAEDLQTRAQAATLSAGGVNGDVAVAAKQFEAEAAESKSVSQVLAVRAKGAAAEADQLLRRCAETGQTGAGASSELSEKKLRCLDERAKLKFELGRPKAAEALWRRLSALSPSDPFPLANLGTALRQQKKLPNAVEAYQAALAIAAANDAAAVNDGGGDAATAAGAASTAVRRSSGSMAAVHFNLGVTLHELERAKEALESLQRAQSLGMRHQKLTALIAEIMTAQQKEQQQQPEQLKLPPRQTTTPQTGANSAVEDRLEPSAAADAKTAEDATNLRYQELLRQLGMPAEGGSAAAAETATGAAAAAGAGARGGAVESTGGSGSNGGFGIGPSTGATSAYASAATASARDDGSAGAPDVPAAVSAVSAAAAAAAATSNDKSLAPVPTGGSNSGGVGATGGGRVRKRYQHLFDSPSPLEKEKSVASGGVAGGGAGDVSGLGKPTAAAAAAAAAKGGVSSSGRRYPSVEELEAGVFPSATGGGLAEEEEESSLETQLAAQAPGLWQNVLSRATGGLLGGSGGGAGGSSGGGGGESGRKEAEATQQQQARQMQQQHQLKMQQLVQQQQQQQPPTDGGAGAGGGGGAESRSQAASDYYARLQAARSAQQQQPPTAGVAATAAASPSSLGGGVGGEDGGEDTQSQRLQELMAKIRASQQQEQQQDQTPSASKEAGAAAPTLGKGEAAPASSTASASVSGGGRMGGGSDVGGGGGSSAMGDLLKALQEQEQQEQEQKEEEEEAGFRSEDESTESGGEQGGGGGGLQGIHGMLSGDVEVDDSHAYKTQQNRA